jgi:16S rRNA (uracil1498-N3)-methyltransferase
MSTPRFYQNKSLVLGPCALDESVSHHILHVLRLKIDAEVIIFNGNGSDYLGKVTQIGKKEVNITLQDSYVVHNESSLKLHLVQAISKREHMDLTIQKAVELGVTEVTPILTAFTNVKYKESEFTNKQNHWQQVIISATQQCGRSVLMKLNPIVFFDEALKNTHSEQRFFLSPRATITKETIQISKNNSITVFIGSEGGFSDKEEQMAEENGLIAIKMGPRILRTETAAIATIAIMQHLCGDL